MGYEWAKENLIHVPYGLVSLEGGKLSTRSGNIVYAEDILKESVSKIREIIAEKNPDLKDKEDVAQKLESEQLSLMTYIIRELKM